MEDRELQCADCGKSFIYTADDQEYFGDKGYRHDPKRCKTCRAKRRSMRVGASGGRPLYKVTCDQCGGEAIVPFQPTGAKPVYCSKCFEKADQESESEPSSAAL